MSSKFNFGTENIRLNFPLSTTIENMLEVNLKRRNFHEWKSDFLATAQEDNKFTDVTLVAKDGQSVSGHRIILSCASPFFATLLSIQAHPHPVILLPTVEGDLLAPLLDFLYLGEVLLRSERLEAFMQMVTCLGLESGLDLENGPLNLKGSQSNVMEESTEDEMELNQKQSKLLEPHSEAVLNTEATLSDEKITDLDTMNWTNTRVVKSEKKVYIQRSQAPSQKEKNLSCDFCDYRIHRNDLLRVHMNSKHDVEKFKCTVASCSKVYSSKSNLKNHMKSWHSCLQCDHEAESNSDLKIHKKNVHFSRCPW